VAVAVQDSYPQTPSCVVGSIDGDQDREWMMPTVRIGRSGRFALATIVAACSLLLIGPTPDVSAATFAVTSTVDEPDASPGSGGCVSAPSGACTLRAAIQEADAAAGADTISLPSGTYALTAGVLSMTSEVTITGAGADTTIIDGGGAAGVFSIANSGKATFASLTIRNGNAGTGTGGGIVNNGTLTLTNVAVSGNRATRGAGIYNAQSATLVITGGAVSGNSLLPTTSNSYLAAGVQNDGTARMVNVTISGNSLAGAMALSAPAGGLGNFGCQGTPVGTFCPAQVSLTNVTLVDNEGVGLASPLDVNQGARATATNTIVANNTGASCTGLVSSSGHNLDSGISCGFFGPGDLFNADPLIGPLASTAGATPSHALLAGSPAVDAADTAACPTTDQRGLSRPKDGNGDGSAACDIGAFEAQAPLGMPTADLQITVSDTPDPLPEGGRLTYTLTVTNAGPGSATVVSLNDTLPTAVTLVSAVTNQGSCPAATPGATTFINCALGTLDSGASAKVTVVVQTPTAGTITNKAVVSGNVLDGTNANNSASTTTTVTVRPSLTFTVDNTADAPDATPGDGVCATSAGACTLRAAVSEANASTAADTIVLPAGVYTLTAGQITVVGTLTLVGATTGSTIVDAGKRSRVFDIGSGATATMSDLTIRNGSVTGPANGGGIRNLGTLTLQSVTVTGSSSASLGPSCCEQPSDGAALRNDGTATLTNVTISGNSVSTILDSPGAVIATGAGHLELINVTVSSNTGVGVSGSKDTITLRNTILASNTAGNCRGTVQSAGNNLDSGTTCGLNGPGDHPSTDPKLAPLGDNGGPTPTHALLAGSPAIDAGSPVGCPSTDQRGLARPRDGNSDGNAVCDVGAFEVQDPPPGACSPRPPVGVQTTQVGPGRLKATLKASTNAGQSANGLQSVQVSQVSNATVDVLAQPGVSAAQTGLGNGQTVTIAPSQPSIEVFVQRTSPGPFTAQLSIGDACSQPWRTLVGGGVRVP